MNGYLATYHTYCETGGMDTGVADPQHGIDEYRFNAVDNKTASFMAITHKTGLMHALSGINRGVDLIRLLRVAEEVDLS